MGSPMSAVDRDWFVFQARLERIVDGDTIDMVADQGFRGSHRPRVRLEGIDTGEIYGVVKDSDEYDRGMEHKRFVADWFEAHDDGSDWPFVLDTEKDAGLYARWPGTIVAKDDGSVLNDDLIDAFPSVED